MIHLLYNILFIISFEYYFYQRTNWISNLPTPPKNVFPTHELKTQDALNQKSPPPLQMTNNRGTDEWKNNKNTYASPRLTQIGQKSSSRPPTVSFYNS